MALIKCPECGKEVSNKAKQCVHCGYPFDFEYEHINKNMCKINGIEYDLTDVLNLINERKRVTAMKVLREKTSMSIDLYEANIFTQEIEKTKSIPYDFSAVINTKPRQQQESNTPKCPTCGSTNIEKISMGKKVMGGAMFGLFSSNVRNTMHCKKCGYKW